MEVNKKRKKSIKTRILTPIFVPLCFVHGKTIKSKKKLLKLLTRKDFFIKLFGVGEYTNFLHEHTTCAQGYSQP